jgi:hypothetical protein
MSSRQPLIQTVFAVPVLLIAVASPVLAQPASEERPVAGFSEIRADRGVDVYLTQGTRESLRIEAEGYALEDVISNVEGGVLILSKSDGRWWPARRVVAHVEVVRLSAITASGGSDVQSRNALRLENLEVEASGGSDVDLDVQARSLEFTLSGGSDLRLSGSTQQLVVEASGGSDAAARQMAAERVRLQVSGGSDASVQASAAIDIEASGGSDVHVFGNPGERRVNNDKGSDVIWD